MQIKSAIFTAAGCYIKNENQVPTFNKQRAIRMNEMKHKQKKKENDHSHVAVHFLRIARELIKRMEIVYVYGMRRGKGAKEVRRKF